MRRGPVGWTMGLHPYDDPAAIFQLTDCPITDERVVATWREIMTAAAHLPNVAELRGTVRIAGDEIAVVVKGGSAWPAASRFFAEVPSASALWWAAAGAQPRLLFERRPVPAGAAFGQVNREVGTMLHAHVVDRTIAYHPATVVDAYAGTGETATALASLGVRVTAIEVDREAAELCSARLPAGSRSLIGRVESLIARALPADVVIVNPPRTGLHEHVAAALIDRPATMAIVYISCDPATLARDLSRLPGYRIASLRTFDMFPQTAHVETVCELVPATP
jgi:23S rRNA (uracil1939-C5)-methyltransferase